MFSLVYNTHTFRVRFTCCFFFGCCSFIRQHSHTVDVVVGASCVGGNCAEIRALVSVCECEYSILVARLAFVHVTCTELNSISLVWNLPFMVCISTVSLPLECRRVCCMHIFTCVSESGCLTATHGLANGWHVAHLHFAAYNAFKGKTKQINCPIAGNLELEHCYFSTLPRLFCRIVWSVVGTNRPTALWFLAFGTSGGQLVPHNYKKILRNG